MKKIHLLLIAFLLSVSAMAQTRLTSPQSGSISIQNPGESLITTYGVDKVYFSLANNNVRLYLLGTGPSSTYIIANNAPNQYLLNGANGTDTATVKTYLMSLGVGKTAAGGGGGGGGGDASAANQVTGNGLLSQINTKTPTLGAKTSSASEPVVLATDQARIRTDLSPTNAISLALTTDQTFATPLRGIWVGVGGSIKVDMSESGTAITFTNVSPGYLSGSFTKVYSTANGTTATALIGTW